MLKPITLAVMLAGVGSLAHADAPSGHAATAAERAKHAVQDLAFSAFPTWVAANPMTACPATLEELVAVLPGAQTVDPWGHRYALLCGPTLPAGARGLAASSPGPDGKPGTADDIRSWK